MTRSKRYKFIHYFVGGYLTGMVGLDKQWLAKHNINTDRIAGQHAHFYGAEVGLKYEASSVDKQNIRSQENEVFF